MTEAETSLSKLFPPHALHSSKNQYVMLKFGAFSYKGDVAFLQSVVEEVLKLSQTVDLSEPDEIGKVYQ